MSSTTISIAPEILEPIVGAKVLELLGEETRNKLLCEAVKEAIKGWEARQAVERTVAVAATQFAKRVLDEPEMSARLEGAVRDGIDKFILNLPDRIEAMLKKS